MEGYEIDYALAHLTVLVDTREQPTQRSQRRISDLGLSFRRQALPFGDYSAEICLSNGSCIPFDRVFAVERKMDLGELCACFCHDRKRFTSEFDRAQKAGAKIYLLVENADMEKAVNGKYRSKMAPTALVASLFTWLARYNCQIIMCKEETSGRIIREIIIREVREYLANAPNIGGET